MATIATQVTNAGLTLFGNAMIGSDTLNNVYIAVGTGSSALSATDTKLNSESSTSGSRAKANVTAGTNPGEVTISVTLAATDAVSVAIAEVGVFSGNAASSTINTGTLLMRALYSHTKTNAETLTLSFDFTV